MSVEITNHPGPANAGSGIQIDTPAMPVIMTGVLFDKFAEAVTTNNSTAVKSLPAPPGTIVRMVRADTEVMYAVLNNANEADVSAPALTLPGDNLWRTVDCKSSKYISFLDV